MTISKSTCGNHENEKTGILITVLKDSNLQTEQQWKEEISY